MARTQATSTEILDDSLTGDDIREESLETSKIPFVGAGFSSTNIQDAVIEAKNSNGHYSYKVVVGQISIPENEQMIVFQDLLLKSSGDITINKNGEAVICH